MCKCVAAKPVMVERQGKETSKQTVGNKAEITSPFKNLFGIMVHMVALGLTGLILWTAQPGSSESLKSDVNIGE